MMDLGKNDIGIINICFLKIFWGTHYIIIKEFSYCASFLERKIKIMQIKLEPRDVARLDTFGNNKCRKCTLGFVEGDTVLRIGAKPPKYFHLECFKPY
jgi:hypothetical protein